MKKSELANSIRLPREELETAYISEFNKNVLLGLSDEEFIGDVDDEKVKRVRKMLQAFLKENWPEKPFAHKYVIHSCLALAFLFEKPMHPQDKVQYITRIEDGKERYYCPYNEKGTLCDFCAARPMIERENREQS